MTQLHQWFQQEYRIGYAEPGEYCKGHRGPIPVGMQCLTLRLRHVEREMWGPVIEAWCIRCAEFMDVRVGPRGGEIVRGDSLRRDLGTLTTEFWLALRDAQGRDQRRIPAGRRKWF